MSHLTSAFRNSKRASSFFKHTHDQSEEKEMFPTVGLCLPGTVHGNMPSPSRGRPQSQPGQEKRRLSARPSFDRGSLTRTSVEDLRAGFSSISTAFRFADFVTPLSDPSSEIHLLVNVIQRVRDDVATASRLRSSDRFLEYSKSHHEERAWVDSILMDVQSALNDIGIYVENIRVAGDEGGPARMRRKFEWVLRHQHKVRDRQAALVVCHQSLSTAINFMQMVEMGDESLLTSEGAISMIYEAPTQPWMQAERGSLLRSPYMRQKNRLSQRNLSLPSIRVSEAENDKLEVSSVNSDPVELPGSTPEDLPEPDDLDLYASPVERCIVAEVSHTAPLGVDATGVQVKEDGNEFTESENISPVQENEDGSPPITPVQDNTVPMTARRYRPYRGRAKPVHVSPRLAGRHRSLPIQLPEIAQTSSLVEDLARWVIGYDAQGTDMSVPLDTPSTSATVSPTVPTSAMSCPVRLQSCGSHTSAASTSQSEESEVRLSKLPESDVLYEDSPTLPQEPYSPRSEDKSSIEQNPSNSKESVVLNAHETKETETGGGKTPSQEPCVGPATSVESNTPELGSGTGENSMSLERPVPQRDIADQDAQTPPPLPPRPTRPALSIPPTFPASTSPSDAKPKTSQAKRRMAHRRRMQAVYGSESE